MKLAAREIIIENELRKTGMGGTRKGFWAMVWSISLVLEEPMMTASVAAGLYPRVAEICGMSKQCIMRDMRYLVEWCWNFGDREALYKIMGRQMIEKPTVGEFIDLVASHIRSEGLTEL